MHKLYGVGFGFDIPNCTFSFSVMILTLKPPSRSTSSIKKFLLELASLPFDDQWQLKQLLVLVKQVLMVLG
jgi:hypothetical protein